MPVRKLNEIKRLKFIQSVGSGVTRFAKMAEDICDLVDQKRYLAEQSGDRRTADDMTEILEELNEINDMCQDLVNRYF